MPSCLSATSLKHTPSTGSALTSTGQWGAAFVLSSGQWGAALTSGLKQWPEGGSLARRNKLDLCEASKALWAGGRGMRGGVARQGDGKA